jgi:hypothetical protein
MGRETYRALFKDIKVQVGSFTNSGLLKMYARYPDLWDHVMFYILFGDPATRLHYKPAVNIASSGYQGTLQLQQKPAARGTGVYATLSNQVYASTTVNGDDGTFGLFYVPADIPQTDLKEGGVPGDSVVFKTVIGPDTLRLYPSYAWKAGEVQTVKLSLSATGVNETQVEIDVFADNKKFGQEVVDGDFLAKTTVLSALLTPKDGDLNRADIVLSLNGSSLPVDDYQVQSEAENGVTKLRVIYLPAALADGEYRLGVAIAGATAEKEVSFALQSTLQLSAVVNFPNPFSGVTQFTYVLENDQAAAVEIKIYTVAGRLIRSIVAAAGQVGYNETPWDGCDGEGEELANGVYFYKISADDGEEKAEVVERLVVMR